MIQSPKIFQKSEASECMALGERCRSNQVLVLLEAKKKKNRCNNENKEERNTSWLRALHLQF